MIEDDAKARRADFLVAALRDIAAHDWRSSHLAHTSDTAREAADLIEKIAAPRFDAMVPQQEALAIKFCNQIAGRKGEKPMPPDPVLLLSMAEDLYNAEINNRT